MKICCVSFDPTMVKQIFLSAPYYGYKIDKKRAARISYSNKSYPYTIAIHSEDKMSVEFGITTKEMPDDYQVVSIFDLIKHMTCKRKRQREKAKQLARQSNEEH